MQAARELVEEGGPAAITYSALAERSGVGRATLYRHWPQIDDLWAELRGELVTSFQAQLTGDLAVDLRLVLRQMAGMLAPGQPGPSLVTLLERSQWDPETRAHLLGAERMNPVRLAFRIAQERGTMPPDTDVDAFCALVLGPLLYRSLMTDRPPDDAFAAALVDAVMAAWGPDGSTGRLRLP
jgi:AcrR family transcriptional regulator